MAELKYKEVEKYIKNYIKKQDLEAGDQLPTENQLADKLNIHQNTVKKGLNNLVHQGIIARKQGKGTYVSDELEKSTEEDSDETSSLQKTIGIIVLGLLPDSTLCTGIIRGADKVLVEHDFSFILGDSDNDFDKIKYYLKQFFARNVDGIIIMPLQTNKNYQENYEVIDKIRSYGCPFVLVDRYIKGVNLDYVVTDNEKAGYSVTKHLIGLGHEKIAFILEPFCSSLEERFMGYRLALAEINIAFNEDLVYWSDNRLDQAGKEGVKELLKKEKFSALICSNDWVARGAYHTLQKKGLEVPEDMSLVGFDASPVAYTLPVKLTTYRQDPYQMGKKAADLLLQKINGKEETKNVQIKLDGELIVGKSTEQIMNFNNKKNRSIFK